MMSGPTTQERRPIEDATHNTFIAEGVDPHTPTRMVPPSLLGPISPAISESISSTQEEIREIAERAVGAPFYSDKGFILYHGDSCELLPRLQKAGLSVDLTVTSPPYNIGKEYEQCLSTDTYVNWCSQWMNQVYDLTRPEGAFWLNVGYLEVRDKGLCVPIPYLIWEKSPFYMLQEVVWQYGAGVSAKARFSPRNEKWLFYVKSQAAYTFNLDAVRDPNVKYPNQKKNGKFRCNPLGKNPGDVWMFPKVTTGTSRSSKERTGHPAQFPLAVVDRIVKVSSNPVDVIFDPFAGSCSAGIAAAGLGRIFFGIEIRRDYCEIAAKRYQRFQELRRASEGDRTLF